MRFFPRSYHGVNECTLWQFANSFDKAPSLLNPFSVVDVHAEFLDVSRRGTGSVPRGPQPPGKYGVLHAALLCI